MVNMESQNISKEFKEFSTNIRSDIAEIKKSINALNTAIDNLSHRLELTSKNNIIENDARYCKKDEMVNSAILLLNNQDFRKRCNEVVDSALNTEQCKDTLRAHFSAFVKESRDNLSKWIEFIKLVASMISGSAITYIIIKSIGG
jgi:hypothetical protein